MHAAVCQQVLPGPEAAARAAAAASHKKRPEAEKVLAQAVANALHLLGTLSLILPLLSGVRLCSAPTSTSGRDVGFGRGLCCCHVPTGAASCCSTSAGMLLTGVCHL